jgi:hypothetical protein
MEKDYISVSTGICLEEHRGSDLLHDWQNNVSDDDLENILQVRAKFENVRSKLSNYFSVNWRMPKTARSGCGMYPNFRNPVEGSVENLSIYLDDDMGYGLELMNYTKLRKHTAHRQRLAARKF